MSEMTREPEEKKEPVSRGRGRSRRRTRQIPWQGIAAAGLAAAAVAAGFYVFEARRFADTYLPHTVVNGMDVAGRTAREVEEMISRSAEEYVLTLSLRGEETETLTGAQLGLQTGFDGSLEEIIHQQNPYSWFRYLLKGPSYEIAAMITYDDASLEDALSALPCLEEDQAEKPQAARISDYEEGSGYRILPESEGTWLNRERVKEAVAQAAQSLEPSIDLDALGCYEEPSVRAEDPALIALCEAKNRYVNTRVTYRFGSRQEVLDGSRIHQWLQEENGKVSLDQEQVAEYVKALGRTYNTAYTTRTFRTSYGSEVELKGFYGWRINQSAETQELAAILEAGESVEREPVYLQTAASHDGNDYGTTYAEVNLTAQHLFFYKDGKKVLESDFVSGNVAKGYTTPPGMFSITYKQRDAVLRGEGYASPVNFWMPFNGGIGFHDASWRSSFGGSIYKRSGSHGCVNMPYEAAKTLYAGVYAGMPVICYNLEGTEQTTPTNVSGKPVAATTAAPPQTTAAPEQTTVAPSQTAAAPEQTTAAPPQTTAAPEQTTQALSPGGPGQTAAPEETASGGPGLTQPASGPAQDGPGTTQTAASPDAALVLPADQVPGG